MGGTGQTPGKSSRNRRPFQNRNSHPFEAGINCPSPDTERWFRERDERERREHERRVADYFQPRPDRAVIEDWEEPTYDEGEGRTMQPRASVPGIHFSRVGRLVPYDGQHPVGRRDSFSQNQSSSQTRLTPPTHLSGAALRIAFARPPYPDDDPPTNTGWSRTRDRPPTPFIIRADSSASSSRSNSLSRPSSRASSTLPSPALAEFGAPLRRFPSPATSEFGAPLRRFDTLSDRPDSAQGFRVGSNPVTRREGIMPADLLRRGRSGSRERSTRRPGSTSRSRSRSRSRHRSQSHHRNTQHASSGYATTHFAAPDQRPGRSQSPRRHMQGQNGNARDRSVNTADPERHGRRSNGQRWERRGAISFDTTHLRPRSSGHGPRHG